MSRLGLGISKGSFWNATISVGSDSPKNFLSIIFILLLAACELSVMDDLDEGLRPKRFLIYFTFQLPKVVRPLTLLTI